MSGADRLALFAPSLRGGGVERVMCVLSQGMVEMGFEVDLVLARAEGPLLATVDPRVRVEDLGSRRVLGAIAPLAGYLRRRRPRAMLAGMTHANVAAVIARGLARSDCRLVVSTHNYLTQASRVSPRRFDRVMPLLARWFYGHADHATAVSEAVALDLRQATGLPTDFVSAIPNPVDVERVRERAEEELQLQLPSSGRPLLVAIGRLVPEKGFDVLIAALARLENRDTTLVIAGEGPQREFLQREAERLGVADRLVLAGFLDNPFALMKSADALVAPSRLEGFGNVLVEGMACGTPVVATTCPGGPAEILDGGRFGPLVPVGDAAALAEAIETALGSPVGRDELLARARDFSHERIVERMLEVMLGEPRG